ncbi:MAG: HipA-like protein [Herminiimonas sp.]|nr:HipA-like protein [Herminiimonas sp.]
MKTSPDAILRTLRTWHRMPAKYLREREKISAPTLMRVVQTLGGQVVTRGKARRTAYAARRTLRGETGPISLYRIDENGRGAEVATLDLIHPAGCAMAFKRELEWPLEGDMRDGWFDGIPYPLDDMRPQGFLGRNFARLNADLLQVPADPRDWSEDHVFWALSIFGADQPGSYILGAAAYRRFLGAIQDPPHFLTDDQIPEAYAEQARAALNFGVVGSSAGGEFPKFTACKMHDGGPVHVIVKFSGNDKSAGTRRWADLLVCEHLALRTVSAHLGIESAQSSIHQFDGRTFLEVLRFDRHGMFGRSGVCSWASINAALFGLSTATWTTGAQRMLEQAMISEVAARDIRRLCHFGQLISNSDMHDGNLAFRPSTDGVSALRLAPVYDMLPMHYAPMRGVELPRREFSPVLPLPEEEEDWEVACRAATEFWLKAAGDARISAAFRKTCASNAKALGRLMASATAGSTALLPAA